MRTERYDTDLTDDQFALVEPFLPRPKRTGRPPAELREVLNAILYLVRTGCQWRLLPHDFPPWSTVHTWYRRWRNDGTWDRIHEALRERVRTRAGRDPSPRSSAADSQSVKTTPQGGERGYDAGKKVSGRKRHAWVDSLGLLLAVVVTAGGVHGPRGGGGLFPSRPWGDPPAAGGRLTPQPHHGRRPGARGVSSSPAPAGGGQPARGRGGLRQAAAAVGGGAHLRVAEPVAAAEQGLRAADGLQRGDDQGQHDTLDAPATETR